MTLPPILRAGRDDDADAFIALIGACWAEYPGCVMDVDGEVPELRALASYYAEQGGALWVAEASGRVVGMVATRPLDDMLATRPLDDMVATRPLDDMLTTRPLDDATWEICKMYAYPDQRGTGLARTLIDTAEGFARAQGGTRVKLWTDTRFDRAHRFYAKCSYVRSGPIRVLGDLSNSLEFAYAKPLAGVVVERLDAAGAVSAEPLLSAVLKACVDAGASVGFLPPLAPEVARAYWKAAASQVATGRRLLLAAWDAGALVGTVSLSLDLPENQPHRADVQKLLVLPAARRRGIAGRLLRAAEEASRAAGRTVLTLDTRVGDGADALYRRAGWTEVGVIPDFTQTADGTPESTVIFYKAI